MPPPQSPQHAYHAAAASGTAGAATVPKQPDAHILCRPCCIACHAASRPLPNDVTRTHVSMPRLRASERHACVRLWVVMTTEGMTRGTAIATPHTLSSAGVPLRRCCSACQLSAYECGALAKEACGKVNSEGQALGGPCLTHARGGAGEGGVYAATASLLPAHVPARPADPHPTTPAAQRAILITLDCRA